MTSYERAIGISKSRDGATNTKKPKKHKLCEIGKRGFGVVSKKSTRRQCSATVTEATRRTAPCDCKIGDDRETSHDTCRRRGRGWFLSSWLQSDDKLEHSSSTVVDHSVLGFPETLTGRACSQLAELHLECSSAAKWSELKRSQREDSNTLFSSPAGVLWSGNVKPLVRPSRATSVGKFCFYFLIIIYFML